MFKVDGLPEGWNVLAFRKPKTGEHYFSPALDICQAKHDYLMAHLIVEKIQPRRIVLEEISKEEYHRLFNDERCSDIYNMRGGYWREVKETDIPLTKEDPKLSLSVDECRELQMYGMSDSAVSLRIREFLKGSQTYKKEED